MPVVLPPGRQAFGQSCDDRILADESHHNRHRRRPRLDRKDGHERGGDDDIRPRGQRLAGQFRHARGRTDVAREGEVAALDKAESGEFGQRYSAKGFDRRGRRRDVRDAMDLPGGLGMRAPGSQG